jgi:uncharacterized protein
MIAITEKFTINAPADDVWTLFTEPVVVASCIPGVTLGLVDKDGSYQGTMVIRFGPTKLTLRGQATLTYDNNARICKIDGRGLDQKGMSRAIASGEISVSGLETSEVSVQGSYTFTGPLEGFARSGGVHVVRALMSEFAGNVDRLLGERRGTSKNKTAALLSQPVPKTSVPPSTPPLSAAKLFWQAFMAWLAQLRGKANLD